MFLCLAAWPASAHLACTGVMPRLCREGVGDGEGWHLIDTGDFSHGSWRFDVCLNWKHLLEQWDQRAVMPVY